MHLSKLEISGFKSFPRRTELLFEEGVMGVVGPNGCGKTNILDSIRWVLGEQRPTMLRSSRIDDVLFNGTADMAPTDMAEVVLRIKNSRGILPIEYDEVVITRRLFRSGESEYLINNNPCRLKDIVSLFADTGMGTHAYSVFQSSMIDAILSDNADERRFLFEEAAGITKYKIQRKEALKKLENTEADMLRLSDIIGEISKNVRSLQRQAGKAKRHKTLKNKLAELEAKKASAQLYELRQKFQVIKSRHSEAMLKREAQFAKIDKAEAEVTDVKLELTALEEKIAAQFAESSEINDVLMKLENQLASIQNAITVGKEKAAIWSREISAIEERKKSIFQEKDKAEVDLAENSVLLEQLAGQLVETESELLRSKEKLNQAEVSYNRARDRLQNIENELLVKATRLEALKKALDESRSSGPELGQSLAELQKKIDDSRSGIELQRAKIRECETAIGEIDSRINENQQAQLGLINQIQELRQKAATVHSEMAAAQGKADILEQLISRHEGYGSGVKAIFNWDNKPAGVIDTLANLIKTGNEYRAALEAAAERYGQLIICEGSVEVQDCIEYLKSTGQGRAGFISLEIAQKMKPETFEFQGEGYLGTLGSFIQADEAIRPIIELLFGGVAVFGPSGIPADFIGEAVDLAGNYRRGSIMEGGNSISGIVTRKGDLARWKESAINLSASLAQLSGEIETAERRLADSRSMASQLQEKKKSLLLIRDKLIAELSRIEFEFKDGESTLKRVTREQYQAQEKQLSIESEIAAIEREIADLEAARASHLAEFGKLTEAHRKLSAEYQSIQVSFNDQRIKHVELAGLVNRLRENLQRHSEIIAESDKIIAENLQLIQATESDRAKLLNEQKSIEQQHSISLGKKENSERIKDELINRKSIIASKYAQLESDLKKCRGELNGLNEEIHRFELQLAELENQCRNIEDAVFHEYGIKIEAFRSDDYDEYKITADITRLRRVVERLGPVNMLAFEEYEAERDRLGFLENQMKDLEEAKSSLREAISKINQTAREKFNATFEKIRGNFQKVFESLFEGGTTELKLTNPDDVLESPIEIIARPGSKKVSSLSQLSGGERALTAISLLFGIYLVKPSPFCILDEIDAPLDDANVNRFLKLLDQFKSSTQFIVITHNKKTMEAANVLYGVTMERPGISSIVSVRFEGDRLEKAVAQ